MFGIFKPDPIKKLRKQQREISEKAVHFQRNGDLRKYAELINEVEKIEKEIADLQKAQDQ